MKKSGRKLSFGESAAVMLLLLCLVLAASITAIRIASNDGRDDAGQLVELSPTDEFVETIPEKEEQTLETAGEKVVNEEMDLIAMEDQLDTSWETPLESWEIGTEERNGEEEPAKEAPVPVSAPAAVPAPLKFSAEEGIRWPIEGNVVLDYSMDASIYFPTLKQYKYNPAIVVSAEEGSPVSAGVLGKVQSVKIEPETGTTLTMDLGDGYTAVYGQLNDVPFTEGDLVESGDRIGIIGAPTKYYSVEGSSLYFQLQKDGAPVDPLDYLK